MSFGFSDGNPDFFSSGGRSTTNMINTYNNTNLNPPQQQFPFRSPLSGIFPDPGAQIRRPDFIGKRSFGEFQLQLQNQQPGLGFYNRNVKPRSNYQQYSSPVSTLSPVPSISSEISSISSGSVNSRYGLPILQQNRPQSWSLLNRNVAKVSANFSLPNLAERNKEYWNNSVTRIPGLGLDASGQVLSGQDQSDKKAMDQRLLELEKELLGDEEIGGENVSVVTDSEWSETIQNLIKSPTRNNPISPSPTSSSSSCSSTLASPPACPKQSMMDAATAISDGKPEVASEILTRLQQVANAKGTSEQRLTSYMVSALKSRVNPNERPPVAEIYGKEHAASTQMLYDVSPCFKLGFMAANLSILEAISEQGLNKIHVVDFDIGHGGQYVHLLHALAAAKKGNENKTAGETTSLKITTLGSNSGDERMKNVGEGLRALAQKIGVSLSFEVKNLNISDLTREKLQVQSDEALVVNFAFKLYKLPDESVTTENLRDELLRRVKGLSPVVTIVVEQEMNANTASLVTRVKDACDHYGALFDSLDATMSRDHPERVRIEEGMGRKLVNSVACEGRDRVERCEVFGKWRARMSMAGFQPRVMSQIAAESLRSRLKSGTRGNPGFTVSEQSGGICFGWKGRTLTVASAWR